MLHRATCLVLPVMVMLLGSMAAAEEVADRIAATPRAERAVAPLRAEIEAESPDLASKLDQPLTLEECIGIALSRNIPLMVARRSLEASQARAGGAIGQFLPELQISTSRDRIEQDAQREYVDDSQATLVQKLPLGTTVEAGLRFSDSSADETPVESSPSVVVTQPLLRSGGWTAATANLRDRRYSARIDEAKLRSQVLSTIFDVTTSYLDLERRRQLVEVNQRAVDRDQELLNFSKAKLEAQLATQRDVLSAEIILAQDRGRVVNAEADYQTALDILSNTLGLRIPHKLVVQPFTLEIDSITTDEEAWIRKAMRDNPTIEAVRLDCERSELAKQVAGNDRLPQLDLSVAYNQRRIPLSNIPAQRTWSGSVTMSYPIFNKELGGAYNAAQLEYDVAQRNVVDTERQVVLSVRDAARNLNRGAERIVILKKNIEGAKAKVEFAKVNFQLGRASNLDITDAQKDLLTAETDYVDEVVVYRAELARLEQLLGGSIHD
jgi:outer membrane protein